MENWESPVDRVIREAQERGEFDDLPGSGKPLRSLGDPEVDDPDWWVKGLVEREQLDMTAAMPPALALRKEAASYPGSLLELRTEESVRLVLEDFNRRVKVDRLRPAVGVLPPLLARTVDVEDLVTRWGELRHQRAATGPGPGPAGPSEDGDSDGGDARRAPDRGWLRRVFARG